MYIIYTFMFVPYSFFRHVFLQTTTDMPASIDKINFNKKKNTNIFVNKCL